MKSLIAAVTFLLLLYALGCGSSRQLQSITAKASGMTRFQFTASGTFSASPTSVTPLAVNWFVIPGNVGIDPVNWLPYSLTNQPFSVSCTSATVVAIAPANPDSPPSGTIPWQVYEDLALSRTKTSEGGFVASRAQTIFCP